MLTVWDWMETLADCVANGIADGDDAALPEIRYGYPNVGVPPADCCGTGVITAEHGERWPTSGTWPPRSQTIEQREFQKGCTEVSSAQKVTISYYICGPTITESGGMPPKDKREEYGLRLAEAEARTWAAIICCLPEISKNLRAKVGLDNLIPLDPEGGCGGFRVGFTVELPSCCVEPGTEDDEDDE